MEENVVIPLGLILVRTTSCKTVVPIMVGGMPMRKEHLTQAGPRESSPRISFACITMPSHGKAMGEGLIMVHTMSSIVHKHVCSKDQ